MSLMKIKEITCKTALTKSKLPGLMYSLNPYLGCMHQCNYCYAPGILHMDREKWETTVAVKRNIPLILSKELKQKKQGTIGISTVTDPYQPIEKTYKLTKYCLETLSKYKFPLCIQTKSDLIIRDKEIITKCKDVEIMVSIGTLNDKHRKIFEPGSSTIPERLNILKEFSNTNVKTSVFFGPIYPNINSDDIPKIMDTFIECEVDEIMIDYLHLKKEIIPILTDTINDNKEINNVFTMQMITSQKEKLKKINMQIRDYLRDTNISLQDAF